ncbi:MAG: hypothetical protein QOE05_1707 [Actinomycetota bacterium]|nr:hypothetical protein [Actinomycetota bacterium]
MAETEDPADGGSGEIAEMTAEFSPQFFDLAGKAGWEDLRAVYKTLQSVPLAEDDRVAAAPGAPTEGASATEDRRDPLETIWELVESHGATRALREPGYVDVDWRDEYANFYATTFRSHPDRGERVHFWRNVEYLGYIVIRPVRGRPVSRTMLKPPPEFRDRIAITTVSLAHPYGQAYAVEAAPYISQDLQYGRCAHATIWMVAHYHTLQNRTPRRRMSDIVAAAASRHEIERLVPSPGLTLGQVATALREIGLPAVVYRAGKEPRGENLQSIITRYLNSRLPIILGTFRSRSRAVDATTVPGHMTVLLGAYHGADGDFRVIRHDDLRGPYQTADAFNDVAGDWDTLFVPLPGRIYLVGEVLTGRAERMFARLLEVAPAEVKADLERRKTRVRLYVVDTADYKEHVFSRLPDATASAHAQAPASHWIWIAELQDEKVAGEIDRNSGLPSSRDMVIAELAIDATSDPTHLNWLFGNYPGLSLSPTGEGELRAKHSGETRVALYETGSALGL